MGLNVTLQILLILETLPTVLALNHLHNMSCFLVVPQGSLGMEKAPAASEA